MAKRSILSLFQIKHCLFKRIVLVQTERLVKKIHFKLDYRNTSSVDR